MLIWDFWFEWALYCVKNALRASVDRSARIDAQWLELVGRG